MFAEERFSAKFAELVAMNRHVSTNLTENELFIYFENEIYFSSVFAITDILLLLPSDRFVTIKCES